MVSRRCRASIHFPIRTPMPAITAHTKSSAVLLHFPVTRPSFDRAPSGWDGDAGPVR
jgi:hypothetical protein